MASSEHISAQTPPAIGFGGLHRQLAMLMIFLIAVLNYADRWIFSILIEPIKLEFGLSDTMIGLLTGPAFAILYATIGIPLARLADMWNRKTVIIASLTVWSAMTALCGMAGSLWQLFLFRIGVGVGEAGATPPSQSLIADYYPPEERTGAFSIFNLGPVVGALVAGIGGSVLAASVGWRLTLIWMGVPGLVVGLIAFWLLKEPRPRQPFPRAASLLEGFGPAIKEIMGRPSFVHLLIGFTLNGFLLYGVFVWTLPFALRQYAIPIERLPEVAVPMSLIQAAAGAVSITVSGWLGNRLAAKDMRWLCRLCAFALIASFPIYVFKFATDSFTLFLVAAAIAHFILLLAASPAYASLHAVIGSRHRALAMAFVLFVTNLVGMGAGPLITGIVSDLLQPTLGGQSLQAAMLIMLCIMPWAAWHFLRAARFLVEDIIP